VPAGVLEMLQGGKFRQKDISRREKDMEKSKRNAIEGQIDEAHNHLQAAKDHLERFQYSEAIEASQRCIEFSVKSSLAMLDIKYALKHEWNEKALSEIAEQIQERRLLDRFTEQHLNYINLSRVLLLANLWGNLYLPAKYGFGGYLAAAKDLFSHGPASVARERKRGLAILWVLWRGADPCEARRLPFGLGADARRLRGDAKLPYWGVGVGYSPK